MQFASHEGDYITCMLNSQQNHLQNILLNVSNVNEAFLSKFYPYWCWTVLAFLFSCLLFSHHGNYTVRCPSLFSCWCFQLQHRVHRWLVTCPHVLFKFFISYLMCWCASVNDFVKPGTHLKRGHTGAVQGRTRLPLLGWVV